MDISNKSIAILVDHSAFRAFDRARLQGKQIVDTRGIWV